MFGLLSGLSAYSLIVLGAVSLVISAVNVSAPGIAISLAMLVHGILERHWRKLFLDTGLFAWNRRMVMNQIGLAVSLSVYALWQLYLLDEEEIRKILVQDSVKPIFRMLDPEMQLELLHYLPAYVKVVYIGVIGLAWLGCCSTALYYLKAGRKLAVETSEAVKNA